MYFNYNKNWDIMQLERGDIVTKEEIANIVMRGVAKGYTHCIIYCDNWDYTYCCKYVKQGEDIHQVIKNITSGGSPGMFSIEEIYNYNLDLQKQLSEERAYHIDPICEPAKKVKEDKENDGKFNDIISEALKKAISYAIKMHAGQTRLNGEPYINHPLHVVQNVLKFKKSKNIEILLISACLHDTIEDTSATYYDIVETFGSQVASLVLELTTDEEMKSLLGKERYLSIKMKNMSSWALVIKLCDRLDNVSDLPKCNDEAFKNKYISETIGILNYLLRNAKLSNTHLSIIEQIICLLFQLCKDNNQNIETLTKMMELIIKWRQERNGNSTFAYENIIRQMDGNPQKYLQFG